MSKLLQRPEPIRRLPEGYQEVRYWSLDSKWEYARLNILSLLPLLLSAIVMLGWISALRQIQIFAIGEELPGWAGLALLIAIFPLHEGLHGLMIGWAGQRARYGIKPKKLALYATADEALFGRNTFIIIALAPLAAITGAGMLLAIFSGENLRMWLALAVIFNATSAIGDLWMVWMIVTRYPHSALVRDEEDGIRIYQAKGESSS